MAMTLKLSKTKALNPQTKAEGFRTTVKSNGKADMDSLVAEASKNTTMHRAELRMAFELALDAIKEALMSGRIVELKGIGNIGFSCSGAWTATAEEQKNVEKKIGVAFYPSPEVHAAVAAARTSWVKEGETDAPANGDSQQKPEGPGASEGTGGVGGGSHED